MNRSRGGDPVTNDLQIQARMKDAAAALQPFPARVIARGEGAPVESEAFVEGGCASEVVADNFLLGHPGLLLTGTGRDRMIHVSRWQLRDYWADNPLPHRLAAIRAGGIPFPPGQVQIRKVAIAPAERKRRERGGRIVHRFSRRTFGSPIR